MTRWFRAYDDAINDPKLLRLSDEMHRAWFTLLCVASKNGGTLPPADDIALTLRVKKTKVAEWITKLTTGGLLDNNDGVFSPHNWSKRQFKSDDPNPRVKRFRDKKRNVSGNVTCNVSETAGVTPPEAEAETDTEQSRADAPAAVDEDLKRRASALGAGISAHFVSRSLPIPNLDRCLHWLRSGYAQGTVLAAVEAVLKRGKAVSTLEYFDGAIADYHAKAPAAPSPDKPALVSVFVEVGTPEWSCWESEHKRLGKRPPFVRDTTIDGVTKTGWWFKSSLPDGYDPCSYEYTPPKSDEAAA